MKINRLVLLNPPGRWTDSIYLQSIKEFSVLFIIYVILNLYSSFSHEGPGLREKLPIAIKNSYVYKMGTFPYNSMVSVGLIYLFLLLSFINRKLSMWLLAEEDSNFSKIVSLELISFTIFILYLILLLIFSLIIYSMSDISIFEYFLILNSVFSLTIVFIVIHLYRYLKLSKTWFHESTSRAFLIWISPFVYIYLFIKLGS